MVLRQCFESATCTPQAEGRLVVSHIKLWASKGNALGGEGAIKLGEAALAEPDILQTTKHVSKMLVHGAP